MRNIENPQKKRWKIQNWKNRKKDKRKVSKSKNEETEKQERQNARVQEKSFCERNSVENYPTVSFSKLQKQIMKKTQMKIRPQHIKKMSPKKFVPSSIFDQIRPKTNLSQCWFLTKFYPIKICPIADFGPNSTKKICFIADFWPEKVGHFLNVLRYWVWKKLKKRLLFEGCLFLRFLKNRQNYLRLYQHILLNKGNFIDFEPAFSAEVLSFLAEEFKNP